MLEWKILGGYVSAKRADGFWQIGVNLASGKWHVFGTDENKFPTLDDAKAWCEEQDRQATQPGFPLPKPGGVWGVPGKPETWKKVTIANDRDVFWQEFETSPKDGRGSWIWIVDSWQSWVRESGAVELVGDREALVTRVRQLEDDISHAVTNAKKYDLNYPLALNTASEAVWALGEGKAGISKACDDWAAKVKELESQLAEKIAERDEADSVRQSWRRACEKAQADTAGAIRERNEWREKAEATEKSATTWEEEARIRAANAEHWRGRFEQTESELKAAKLSLHNIDERAKERMNWKSHLEVENAKLHDERDKAANRVKELETELEQIDADRISACTRADKLEAERDELQKKAAAGDQYYALHQKIHDCEKELTETKASRDLMAAGLRRISCLGKWRSSRIANEVLSLDRKCAS